MIRPTLSLILSALAAGGLAGQERAEDPALPRQAAQHLVVVTEAPDAVQGRLFRMERTPEGWQRAAGAVPVVVGRSGVGPKREGDGRSPQGIFELGPAFGYASRPPEGVEISYRSMPAGAVCVDDGDSRHYNRIVDPDDLSGEPDWTSAEAMRRDLAHGDDLYEWGVEVRYNWMQAPGAGSCIFLHVWRRPGSPTAGCTAMPEGALLAVMRWLRPSDRPVLIQGSRSYLEGLRREGVLPYPVPGGPER